jgi:hypothetical protein
MTIPSIIAAQAAHQRQEAERTLLDAFRLADATAEARAQSLGRLGIERTEAFARLETTGVLRAAGRDRYYLDEAAVVAQRATRHAKPPAGLILVAGLLVLAGLVMLGVLRGGG